MIPTLKDIISRLVKTYINLQNVEVMRARETHHGPSQSLAIQEIQLQSRFKSLQKDIQTLLNTPIYHIKLKRGETISDATLVNVTEKDIEEIYHWLGLLKGETYLILEIKKEMPKLGF